MIPDENVETEAKPASNETPSDRPRSGGRPRYPRGGRGRSRRPPRRPRPADQRPPAGASDPHSAAPRETEPARDSETLPPATFEEPLEAPPVPKGRAVFAAIEKVEAVIIDLKGVINELELVMEYLEDVERQQITDEREIEVLRSRLESLHRRVDRSQPPRHHGGRPHDRPREEPSDQNPA